MRLLLAAITLFLAVPLQAQEEERFEETVDVEIVLVDAIVTNRRGEQILGLGAEDFEVSENGVEQEIESVEYYTNRRLLDQPESQAPFSAVRTETPRNFVLFFDKAEVTGESSRSRLWRAGKQAREFVEKELADGDRVAVAAHRARLEIYSDFSSDHAAVMEAIEEAVQFGNGIDPAKATGPILSELDAGEVIGRTGRIYDAIRVLGEAIGATDGRKVMILFTPGFGEASGFGSAAQNDDIWFNPMVQTLNQAHTSVYILSLLEEPAWSAIEQYLSRLSSETGGEYYRRAVSFTSPLRRIENENNGYYLLTYRTSRPRGEHGYQEIEVKLRNPEFRVKAREGYLF